MRRISLHVQCTSGPHPLVVYNPRFPGQYYDAETGLNYNYFRDYDPASGRYVESDPIGLKGGVSTYAYVGGNPVGARDRYGLSPQDVANAWQWLQQNYPGLTNSVSSVNSSSLLDYTFANGAYNMFTDSISIRKSYYTKCLSDTQKNELLQVLAHEALHVYVDNQIGTLNYALYPYEEHAWITSTAAAIAGYASGMWPTNTPAPSINTFPPPKSPFAPNNVTP